MAIRSALVASCCCCCRQASMLLLVLVLSFTLVINASSSASSSPFSLSLPTTFQLLSKASTQHQHHHHHKSLLLQSSSTVQKQYTKPPHDIKLYDTLHVKPNATLAEIQKSWRRLSRDWHPDKVAVRKRRRRNNNKDNNKRRLQQQRRSDDLNTNASNQNTQQVSEEDDEDEDEQLKLLLEMQEAQEDEDEEEEEYAKQKLAELTTAYDILSDDHTRLLYHKYGLIGGTDAAIQLLSGRPCSPTTSTSSTSSSGNNNEGIGSINDLQTESTGEGATTSTSTFDEQHQSRLLELMGYPPQGYATATSSSSWSHHNNHHRHHQYNTNEARRHSNNEHDRQHQQRLAYLTATITERLRPIVEGTISQDLFVNEFYQEVNALKTSPLGAHILRCIGRAYRIEGYRVLRELHHHHHHQQQNNYNNIARMRDDNGGHPSRRRRNQYHHNHHRRHRHHAHHQLTRRHHHEVVADKVHDRWRDVKHYASAALASGKLVLMEQRMKKLEGEHERRKRQLNEDRQRRRRQRGEQQQQQHYHEMKEGENNGVKRIQRRIQPSSREGEQQTEGNVFASNIGALPGDDNFNIDESNIIDEDVLFHFNNFGDIDNENIGGFSDNEQDDFFSNLFDNENNPMEEGQDNDNDNANDELEHELQHIQHQKLYSALLSAHQMEALWKITKIELDKTIREACRCILSNKCGDDVDDNNDGGWYDAFCPSSSDWHSQYYPGEQCDQPPPPPPLSGHRRHRHHHRRHNQHRKTRPDGWVGTTGEVVSLKVGRLRAAAALILVGDICVQCSKEDTSWNK